jgi:hypothetical protein
MREQFLAGAEVVLTAVADTRVGEAWDRPSVLDDQTIGSLAGHLARGSVWVVADYLARPAPDGASVDFETAAEYYAGVTTHLTDADHIAIRVRGAEVAAIGHAAVVDRLRAAHAELVAQLPTEPPDRLVAVYGDSVMRLDDYLYTRLVEQVVHLDDLARSLGIEPWVNPPDAEALVIACGAEIGRLTRGGSAMLRALFRDAPPRALPVL